MGALELHIPSEMRICTPYCSSRSFGGSLELEADALGKCGQRSGYLVPLLGRGLIGVHGV